MHSVLYRGLGSLGFFVCRVCCESTTLEDCRVKHLVPGSQGQFCSMLQSTEYAVGFPELACMFFSTCWFAGN